MKRIRFLAGAQHRATGEFTMLSRVLRAAVRGCPPADHPLRLAVCTSVPVIEDQRHEAVLFEWFRDGEHMARFDDWWASTANPGAPVVTLAPDEPSRPALVVDEVVVRGADWLEHRWRDGGEKFKHIAIARRADGLSAEEFSVRWRAHAGTVGRPGSTEVVRIPDDARGSAYVQNHPQPRESGEWAYDACNEVYFDDLGGLRRRIEWFDRALVGGAGDDLVKECWFLAMREEVLIAGPADPKR